MDVLHFSRFISAAPTALAVVTANRSHVTGATLELETGIREGDHERGIFWKVIVDDFMEELWIPKLQLLTSYVSLTVNDVSDYFKVTDKFCLNKIVKVLMELLYAPVIFVCLVCGGHET